MRIALLLLLALTACKKNPPDVAAKNDLVVSDKADQKALDDAKRELEANFARVHFEFDSTKLTADARAALSENARILTQHPTIQVEVQGHADERGTIEYNLALGERRAHAVVDQLTAMGVSRERLKIVTFGEEVPLARGDDEVVWAQNRRAEFRVLTASSGVRGTVGG